MSMQQRSQQPGRQASAVDGRGPIPGWGAMGRPTEKAKDFRGTASRLLTYFAPMKIRLLIILLTAIISTVFMIVGPKILGLATTKLFEGLMAKYKANGINNAIDQNMAQHPGLHLPHVSVPSIDFTYIATVLLILLGLYIISSLFSFIQQYMMADVAQKTVYRLRKEVDEKLTRLPLKYFDTRTHGEILSRAVNDMDNISTTLQQSLTQIVTSAISVIGVIIMMLTINWFMCLIVLATLPLSMFITMVIAKRSQEYFREQQSILGVLNGHVEEMYSGHKIVKAFGHEKKASKYFVELNNLLYEASWRAQFVSGIIMPLMRFVGNLGYVLVAIVGSIFVTQGSIGIGDVQAFIQYAHQFTMPIAQLANFANVLQSTIASAERIFELLDEEEQVPEAMPAKSIEAPQGAVQFQHVKFGYSQDAILIEDMNIDVQPGQMVAIVGPTGAGKTTLVNLLMRFYEVNAGQILVDGINIAEMRRGDLRRTFGMVLQDTWLFNGTIYDNIAYGREGASEKEIIQAARAAYADHFIQTLPEGYKTVLSQEATNISQGQKQLMTIARAFLADPEILILDEATSSVDTRTEMQIQRAMAELMKGRTNFVIARRLMTIARAFLADPEILNLDEATSSVDTRIEMQIQKAMAGLMKGRTSFVIAHRLSTIRNADLILVMNHGTIIEKGTHSELLAQNGFYADLYNSQFTASAAMEGVV
jgi:ATP-binding cassette subfamily B multidrug efflux pump